MNKLPENLKKFSFGGGSWLGYARKWIQSNCINGEDVTWGSDDPLKLRICLRVSDIEEIARNAAKLAVEEYSQKVEKHLKNAPQEVFVLLCDSSGTTFSSDEPFGVAVTTEDEAKRFVADGKFGYSQSYSKLTIFESSDEAKSFSVKK